MAGSVLVVGGGIGGMAAAICLARAGRAVDLIDLDPDWRVYGAGITITGPTLRAYRDLGLVKAIAEQGAITNRSRIFRFDGVHLQDLDEPALEEGLPATGGIMRPVLHRLMQDEVRALAIPVRLGLTVTALDNVPGGVEATFSDGTQGLYDLVIGADSINSGVRRLAFPHMQEPERTGQACWRISIRRPPALEDGEFYLGHRYPVGITRCGAEQVYMWMLTPHEGASQHRDPAELFSELKANLDGFGGNAGWIRDAMTPDDWINCRPLAAALQPRPWSNGRVVLLGDAVHATTPHLASGAGMAVESAIVLAEELARADSVEQGLAAYEERRFERCRDVIDTSVEVGRMQLAGGDPRQIAGMLGAALHRFAAPY